jgi:predicted alpha/beta superfamily hydrolase
MKHLARVCMFILALLPIQILSACTSKRANLPSPASTHVTIPYTEVKQIRSTATGRNYDIYIRLPDAYAQNRSKKYPVLYSLDAQWDFKMLDSIYSGLLYDGFIPEIIIVGITYSGDNADYGALRSMDYTPVHDAFIPGSGDAPKFLAFIKEELVPFVDANYHTDTSRKYLLGSSFGGTFTLYAMFTDPTFFSRYIASSPVVTYGNRFAYQQEADYFKSHTDLPVRLFVSVGELEDLSYPVKEFTQILDGRDYPGLEMEVRVIEGERHASNKPESYNRGLRFILEK